MGDLGCGAGMLSIACNLMGSSYTVGFDVDEEALDNAWVNCRKLDIYDIDLVQTDVQSLQLHSGMRYHTMECATTVCTYLKHIPLLYTYRIRHHRHEPPFWNAEYWSRHGLCIKRNGVRFYSVFFAQDIH